MSIYIPNMRIAMIGQKGMPARFGGVERHVHELSVRLNKAGHEVTVYGRAWYTDTHNKLVEGVYSKILPTIHTKHLDAISNSFFSTIDAVINRYDVIHYHGVGPSLLSWIPRLFAPEIKVVTTFHTIDRKLKKWGPIARLFLWIGEYTACRFAHNTITVSETLTQYARDVYNRDTNYIPNGVPQYSKAKKTGSLKEWNLDSGEYFLMVARLIPDKGVHYLIRAFCQLQDKYPKKLGKKKLVIVGDGHYTDKYVNAIKDMAEENQRIVFTGFQTGDALAELYSHAMVVINPSDQEGMPLSVLEAMAYGVPVILSDIAEHKEFALEPELLFRRGKPQSLVKSLLYILEAKKSALQKLSKRSSERMRDGHDWDKIAKQTIAVYQDPIIHVHETPILPV